MSKVWVDTVNVLFIFGNSIASWDVWLPCSSPGLGFVYERQVSSKRRCRHNLRSKASFWMLVAEDLCHFLPWWRYLLSSSLPVPLLVLRVFFSSECAGDMILWDGAMLVTGFSWRDVCGQLCTWVWLWAMQDSVAQVQISSALRGCDQDWAPHVLHSMGNTDDLVGLASTFLK